METADGVASQITELRLGPIEQFALKTAIISVAAVLSVWILLDLLDGFMSRRMQQLDATIQSTTSMVTGRQFWTRLEDELDKMADPRTELPPEKKRKILMQIKEISDRWRPFVAQAAAAIRGEDSQPAK